jgi:type VI secretion system protein ImpJ
MLIHWHEGLFLQPHHFQRMQRGMHVALLDQRRLIAPYPFGILESRIAPDALADFRLRFDFLRVIMPSGQEVRFPDNAELPELSLKPILTGSKGSVLIHLALPLWQEKRANALDPTADADPRAKLLFRVEPSDLADENTGGNPQTILERRLNARLVTDRDDLVDMETVPIARIVLGAGESVGQPRLDPEYIPPSLYLESAPRLHEIVRNLVDQVQGSHSHLMGQVNRASLSLETLHGHQFEQVLRLRTLSRFAAKLPALLRASSHVTPFQWYLELRELLGELAALKLGETSFEVPDYDHQNLFYSFATLGARIRGILTTAVTKAFVNVEFRKDTAFYAASLTEEQLSKPVDFLLAIKTTKDYDAVRKLVIDGNRFKFMPRTMANMAFYGVKLEEEKFPPHFLPNQPGLHYFRVMRTESHQLWDRVQKECEVSIRWPEHAASDFEITLVLVLPS